MKLIVGLGNPGSEYQATRHNAGWRVIDRLVERHAPTERVRARFHADTIDCQVGKARALLLKPTTYMNRSGISIADAVNFFKLDPVSDLLVVVDETALDVGDIRLRAGGGDNGHNGLKDIGLRLGTDQFPRLRVGIGAPHPGEIKSSYVLGRFRDEEKATIASVVDRSANACEVWASEGIDTAMNRFNTRSEGSGWGRKAQEEPPVDKNRTDIDPGWLAG
jgi:peptidyl-tRNA hydrolase, PTH1 family